MSGALIEITYDDRLVQEALKVLAGRTANLRSAMKNIGEYLKRSTWERFSAQTDPGGTPWAPLKPATLLRKKGMKILTESSNLRDRIVYKSFADRVELGTNVVYAAIHQFGGKTRPTTIRARRKKALYWPGASHPVGSVNHPGSTIPARPFLGVSEGDRQELLLILMDHIRGV